LLSVLPLEHIEDVALTMRQTGIDVLNQAVSQSTQIMDKYE
jgi:hypothetical protein